ncbi:MAG: hypothetical protein QM688_05775 [Sphingomonas bacterium]
MNRAARSIAVDSERAEAVVARLRSLHDGEKAFEDVLALGPAARAPLRRLLMEREPSGIWQPRALAARALGAIRHANDILLDYLHHPRFPADPVEFAGEEAVVNAAAEALARNRYGPAFETLRMIVSVRPHLIGAVHALAAYGRVEAIPELVTALGDDGSRHAAEAGLRRFGARARVPLVERLEELSKAKDAAFNTNIRHRHAILGMLTELGLPRDARSRVIMLMNDPDDRLAVAACGVAVVHGPPALRRRALERLDDLAAHVDLRLRIEIDGILRRVGKRCRSEEGKQA